MGLKELAGLGELMNLQVANVDEDGFPIGVRVGDMPGLAGLAGSDDDINWAIAQGGGGGTPWWQSLLQSGVQVTGGILQSRYGVPPAGTVITTPQGQVIRQPPGYPASAAVLGAGLNVGGNLGTPLLLAGAAVVALVLLSRR